MKDEILKLKDSNGNIKEYLILLVFLWPVTNKYYIVYTDKKDEYEGSTDVYAKIFNPDDLSVLEDIKTETEWKVIESKLKELGEN